jgi:hypothetical protein
MRSETIILRRGVRWEVIEIEMGNNKKPRIAKTLLKDKRTSGGVQLIFKRQKTKVCVCVWGGGEFCPSPNLE